MSDVVYKRGSCGPSFEYVYGTANANAGSVLLNLGDNPERLPDKVISIASIKNRKRYLMKYRRRGARMKGGKK